MKKLKTTNERILESWINGQKRSFCIVLLHHISQLRTKVHFLKQKRSELRCLKHLSIWVSKTNKLVWHREPGRVLNSRLPGYKALTANQLDKGTPPRPSVQGAWTMPTIVTGPTTATRKLWWGLRSTKNKCRWNKNLRQQSDQYKDAYGLGFIVFRSDLGTEAGGIVVAVALIELVDGECCDTPSVASYTKTPNKQSTVQLPSPVNAPETSGANSEQDWHVCDPFRTEVCSKKPPQVFSSTIKAAGRKKTDGAKQPSKNMFLM